MGNDKDINQLVRLLKKMQRLNEQELESFNPARAKEYRDYDDENNGVYNDLIHEAAELAKEYHKGQVDKQGGGCFA